MPLYPYKNKHPQVDESAFIAVGARIVGDVEIAAQASVWFNAVLRGDSSHVRIGERSNLQDSVVVHTDPSLPCIIGPGCIVGHGAILHGCRVGEGCLIGMGAILLSGAVIGPESLVAAGALIPEGKEFPPRSFIVGVPGRLVGTLSLQDVNALIQPGVEEYLRYALDYQDRKLPS